MRIAISRKDVLWAYLAQFFSIGSGFLTLPLILHKLSAEEVGFNYVMLAVGSIAALFDLGFVVQFGRNITYVLSGAKELRKKGISIEGSDSVDAHLLKNVIDAARYVYRWLSISILIILLSFGSAYIYYVTGGLSKVDNAALIWLIYCISIFFNVYYKYLDSLLNGAALITESKKATIFSRTSYIIIAYILLLLDFGLISVVVANVIAPFVGRFYSYKKFYTQEMLSLLSVEISTQSEIKSIFYTIWGTTRLLALNMFGSFATNQAGMFIAGFYLSLSEIASYGLMLQFYNILSGLSLNINNVFQAEFCKNRVKGDFKKILSDLSFSTVVAGLVKIFGSLIIIVFVPYALDLIKSNSVLPATFVMVIYSLQSLLHDNMVCFCTYITSGNIVPFVKPSIITAFFIITLMIIFLYMGMGIIGAVFGLMIAEVCYNTWKWPLYVLKEFKVGVWAFYKNGFVEINNRVFKKVIQII